MRATSDAERAANLEACLAILREGSKSFHAASRLLPPRIRGATAAVYGFCRVSDDAVDRERAPAAALARMRERLDAVYRGAPFDHPVDRALADVVVAHRLPRAAFDFLLDGFAWDVEGRRYDSLADLRAYCVRVASTVGVLMTVLMTGATDRNVLARACDLGIAMQLTNIARDVGEDARAGRVYLPLAWLREVRLDPETLVQTPRFRPELGLLVRRLLAAADAHYRLADLGIPLLPRDARLAIAAARHIYADIGRVIVDHGYDSVSQRAVTTTRDKAVAFARALAVVARPTRAAPSHLDAAAEARPLLDAVAGTVAAVYA